MGVESSKRKKKEKKKCFRYTAQGDHTEMNIYPFRSAIYLHGDCCTD